MCAKGGLLEHTLSKQARGHSLSGVIQREKVIGYLGVLLALEVLEWAGKYATNVPEGYDTRPFEALKGGVSSVIFTRVGEGPIMTNGTD